MAAPSLLPDFYARATWDGLNLSQTGVVFEQYVRQQPTLAAACPKVGIGYFWYDSLGTHLRGAKALENIAAGELLCTLPTASLLSEYTVGNSTMQAITEALTREAAERASRAQAAHSARKRSRNRFAPDVRTMITLLVLRETARGRSPHKPYFACLRDHNVDAVPMLWGESSPRWRTANGPLRSQAAEARASVDNYYRQIVLDVIERFAPVLSEGLGCGGEHGTCDRDTLARTYSYEQFARVYAVVMARDWVLPMYGRSRPFLAPILDMLNFGQVGIRVHFDDAKHAFVAVSTRAVTAGSELLFYYGTMCKEEWINTYGFSPQEAHPCADKLSTQLAGRAKKPSGTTRFRT